MGINAPRGTQDVIPDASYQWQFVEKKVMEQAELYGFKEIRTPVFEDINLFMRGVGGTTDIVQKEMFEVKARNGDGIYALRPEGTAGVVRAVLENGLLKETPLLKLCYNFACFRHERPEAGRLREFHQFGCEVFGSSSPATDVEIISLVGSIFKVLGLTEIELNINSIGCKHCREEYYAALKEYFKKFRFRLCPTCIERLEKNPMRILDCKCAECREIGVNAPRVLDYLCDECSSHFNEVKSRLTSIDIKFKINTSIVRGLDYYTKTVFEFISTASGTPLTICAGGRYDGLIEELGGKTTPAIGFGMGIERVLILMKEHGIEIRKPVACEVYIASIGEKASIEAAGITERLRRAGIHAECDVMGRSIKAQLRYADKIGSRYSIVLGEDELKSRKAILKDMTSGATKEVSFDNELLIQLCCKNMSDLKDTHNKTRENTEINDGMKTKDDLSTNEISTTSEFV